MKAPRTFALIDHDLTGPAGHNLTYAQRVLTAAQAAGLRTIAGVAAEALALGLPCETLALFPNGLSANNPAHARLWHAAALLRRRATSATTGPPGSAPAALKKERAAERASRLAQAALDDAGVLAGGRYRARRLADRLQAFILKAGLHPGDVVFMPTALAGEAAALAELVRRFPPARALRWRLLFRYAPEEPLVRSALSGALSRLGRRAGLDLRVYADTEPLRAFYQAFCPCDFALLPIPVTRIGPRPPPDAAGPIVVGLFGDVRDEKGAALLPDMIAQALALGGGRVAFLVQSNLNVGEGEADSRPALQRLQALAGPRLELVPGPLPPAGYAALFDRAHMLALPYAPQAYAHRSSGILMEALAAGLPTVVTQGSWLQTVLDQAPADRPAGRIAAPDPASLAEAISAVALDWPRFAEGAHRLGHALRTRWDPDVLVRELVAP